MTDSWNPPTGPPNGAPVHPNDARHEIDEAVAAARVDDQRLRWRVAAVAAARVRAAADLETATAEAAEARTLAKRALGKANESARAGQRADAAKWTGAAEVFAKRLVDARGRVAQAERTLTAAGPQHEQVQTALAENVGRLQAVAAARLPMIPGRKAHKAQQLVDETVAVLMTPLDEAVSRGEADARAALAAEADAEVDVVVDDDDLERELDVAGTGSVLDELRAELGLPTAGAAGGDPAAVDGADGAEDAAVAADGATARPADGAAAGEAAHPGPGRGEAAAPAPPSERVSGARR